MIHPDCKYLDLYPYTWRNLGELMEFLIPPKKVLYILHRKGAVLKAAASDNTVYPLAMDTYQPDAFCQATLFDRYPDIDEIHILEESSLLHYYAGAQKVSLDEKNTMEYLDFITDFYRCHKGIDLYFRHSDGVTFYRKCLDYAQKNLLEPQILLFVVTKDDLIWFDVLLLAEAGMITEIRTLDTLQDHSWYGCKPDCLQQAELKLSVKFNRSVRTISCTFEELPALTRFWETYHVDI